MKLLNYHKINTSADTEWIVFLHGAGGSIATWKYQLEALKPHFNLLFIDLRDHGKSKNITPEASSYDFDLIASDIFNVLEKEQITKAHFVTLSFGSVLIQALYKRKPELIDQMVLIGGIFNANWMIKWFVHLARFLNLFLPYESMYRTFSYLLMPKKRNQLARRVYQMQARKLSQQEYVKWLGLYSEFFTLLRSFQAQEIPNKLLVLMGADDYLFLPSARKFITGRANAQITLVPAAGHICNIDKPKEVNDAILNFLGIQSSSTERRQTTVLIDTN